jgi:predicted nuclease of restriction endonuclease-like RecB superfamily
LADSINKVADNIEVIIPTAEECQMATDGNKEKREISQKLFSEGSGAAGVTGSSGSVASVIGDAAKGFIDTLIEELKNMFEDIKNQITERYGRILDLINRISNENNIGLQFIALDITVRIGSQLKNRLKELNKSIQESLEEDDGTTPSVQDVPPVDSEIPIFV